MARGDQVPAAGAKALTAERVAVFGAGENAVEALEEELRRSFALEGAPPGAISD